MKISFIIPSVNRPDQLLNCINSIEVANDYEKNLKIEIIVVYNGNGYNNHPLKTKKPEIINFFSIKEEGPSKARNYGILKSTGNYLVFLDDDAYISKDFLKKLFTNRQKDVNVYYARLLDSSDKRPFAGIYNDKIKRKYLSIFDYSYSGGTTMIIKKKTLLKIGQYDERFGPLEKYRAAEETDLFFRCLMNKEKILYLPDLIIFHPIDKEASSAKVFDYAYAIGALFIKQILVDWRRFYVYSFIFFKITLKSLARSAQLIFFPRSIKEKNRRCQYLSVFQGTVSGSISYFRNEILFKKS